MKLGELCEVAYIGMYIRSINDCSFKSFWVHGISAEQRLLRCGEYTSWTVVSICPYHNKIIVDIKREN